MADGILNCKFLEHLYFTFRDHSAWLVKLQKLFQLDQMDVTYLNMLDDAMGLHLTKARNTFRDVPAGFFADDEDGELAELSEAIAEAHRDFEISVKIDEDAADRWLMLKIRKVDEMEKHRGRILAKKYHRPDQKNGSVTDAQIEIARNYPLEKLVTDLNRHGYMRCPFHDDEKPSFLVKNGYGYCFSCQAHADSIKWLMHVNRLNFKDAVRYLAGQ